MENKKQIQHSEAFIELTLFLDDLPSTTDIGFTGDIQKIRFNWESIEDCYGYDLPFETLDAKGNLGAFYLGDFLCVLALSDKETVGKMLLVPKQVLPLLPTVGQQYLAKPMLTKLIKGLGNIPLNNAVTDVSFSTEAPMLIRKKPVEESAPVQDLRQFL